jgi:cysteine desulfurase
MHLDHNAGGRVRPEVADAVAAALRRDLANPSSVHRAGRAAREAVEAARDAVAELVGARPSEVVFVSGGTEANNLALLGAVAPGRHLVTTAIEHASVLRACDAALAAGCERTLLPVSADGRVSAEQVVAAVGDDTALVSIGWANGEIGTLQPVAEIARALAPFRSSGALLVHSDAVQAASLCRIDLRAASVDLLSVSAHKLGGLPGVGALIVASGVKLNPRAHGGPQERERRAGTENVPGIIGFGVAARLAAAERCAYARRAALARERLWEGLARLAAPVARLGPADGLPNTLAVAFPDLRGDALVIALDLEGIAASTGSACAAGAAEPSHVLRAIGCDERTARAALRFSFGPELDESIAERAAATIGRVVRRARDATAAAGRGAYHAA